MMLKVCLELWGPHRLIACPPVHAPAWKNRKHTGTIMFPGFPVLLTYWIGVILCTP